jgi:hypothetical protein
MTVIYTPENNEDGEFLNDFTPCLLKDVKLGEFITRKPSTRIVYTRGEYDRASKRYAIDDYSDGRQLFLRGDTVVYVGFTY